MVSSATKTKTDRQRRRRQRSAGNTILESAFTILPTFAFIFAFVDFGLLLFRWATLQNAVREGCRYAITYQTQTGLGQNASIEAVVQNYAMGIVNTTSNACTGTGSSQTGICVNYYSPTNLDTPISGAGGNSPGNIVQVSVTGVSWNWVAPLSATYSLRNTSPIVLNIYSSDVLGAYPAGVNSVTE